MKFYSSFIYQSIRGSHGYTAVMNTAADMNTAVMNTTAVMPPTRRALDLCMSHRLIFSMPVFRTGRL